MRAIFSIFFLFALAGAAAAEEPAVGHEAAVTPTVPPSPAQRGASDAENPATTTFSVLGFGGGCLLGPIGCLGVTAFADAEPTVPLLPVGTPLEDVDDYRKAYRQKLRERRRGAAWEAGTIGTIFFAAFLFVNAETTCNPSSSNCTSPTEYVRGDS